MTSNRSTRRLALLGGVLVAGAGMGVAFPAEGGAAEAIGVVGATASAQGLRVTYGAPGFVVVSEFVDGGGPIAQATVETGRAVSFASLPYPGENAVFAPGVIGVVLGRPIPVSYPLYARAENPTTPESAVTDPSGAYQLKATAGPAEATGVAAVRFVGDGADAVTASTADTKVLVGRDGHTTAVAETVTRGLSFGEGVLTIGSVRSRSVTVYEQGEKDPTTTTELTIEGARVAGEPVAIGPDGVHAGGQTVELPTAEVAQQVNGALERAGISVRTVTAEPVVGGGSADVLEVRSEHPVPGTEGTRGTVTWRIGGTTSTVALGPATGSVLGDPSTGTVGEIGAPSTSEPAVTAAGSGEVPGGSAAGQSSPSPPAAPNTSFASEASLSPVGDALGAVPAPSASTTAATAGVRPAMQTAAQPAMVGTEFPRRMRRLSAVLTLGALALVASTTLWRFKGVRG